MKLEITIDVCDICRNSDALWGQCLCCNARYCLSCDGMSMVGEQPRPSICCVCAKDKEIARICRKFNKQIELTVAKRDKILKSMKRSGKSG